jgi:hypothetical protein
VVVVGDLVAEPGYVALSGLHVVVLGAIVGVIADVGALWSAASPLNVAGVLEVGDCCREFGNFRGVGVCSVGRACTLHMLLYMPPASGGRFAGRGGVVC